MSAETSPLVHLHIPKTAGTSLRAGLIDSAGAENVICYYRSTNSCIRASDRVLARETRGVDALKAGSGQHRLYRAARAAHRIVVNVMESRQEFPPAELSNRRFDVLTGHIEPAEVVPNLPADSRFVSFIRDPLARSYSHYRHWMRSRGKAVALGTPAYRDDMSFAEFALSPEQQNYQSERLGELGRNCMVGAVEDMASVLEELTIDPSSFPHLNTAATVAASAELCDPGFVRDFEGFHAVDAGLHADVMASGLLVVQNLQTTP